MVHNTPDPVALLSVVPVSLSGPVASQEGPIQASSRLAFSTMVISSSEPPVAQSDTAAAVDYTLVLSMWKYPTYDPSTEPFSWVIAHLILDLNTIP